MARPIPESQSIRSTRWKLRSRPMARPPNSTFILARRTVSSPIIAPAIGKKRPTTPGTGWLAGSKSTKSWVDRPNRRFGCGACGRRIVILDRRTRTARIEQIERDKLGARQQALYDEIMRTRPRGILSGPFSVWIYRPDIAEPANAMANCFRVSPKLDKRLIELIV